MNASKELTLKNPAYKKAVDLYVWQAYLQDLGTGDITTEVTLPKKPKQVIGILKMKESGVLAGMQEAEYFLKKLSAKGGSASGGKIKVLEKKKDGTKVKKGDVILKIKGSTHNILAAERTLLNLTQRMSGIATLTHTIASKLPKNISLLATRKTVWGFLDKRAVSLGGGGTHRLNLNDAILIKDNHISVGGWKNALEKAIKSDVKRRFIEIEFDTKKEVKEFLEWSKTVSKKDLKNLVVMLDNFSPADISRLAPLVSSVGVTVEVSGGITRENIEKYACTGVSAISMSAITTKGE